ncbi:MAG: SDR family NAD(P)-dependent oxidoreductase [Armatimonadota bacterium]
MIPIDLSGKNALVTGASSGLGAEMARTLARAGAGVVVNYHGNRQGAEEVAEAIRSEGGRALVYQADVADRGAVDAMVEAARRELGPLSIVVNNAGRELRLAAPFELAWADYQQMLDLNLQAIYNTVSAAYPDMQSAGWGRVVNIGSVAFNRPFPGSAAYSAAKGAMLGVTHALANELGKDGITVNYVAPGWIPVERHASAPPEALEKLLQETPLGRRGAPEDIAGVVLFFCSDLAAFVTGAHLPVAGGHGGYIS